MKKVSIIIPYIGLNSYVEECVNSCLKQDYKKKEIILLSDIKENLPKEWKKRKEIKVIITGNEKIGKKRNIGIKASKEAEYFACIDSDAFTRDDKWIKNAIDDFEKDLEIWAVGGPNICPPKESLKEKAVGNALKSILVSGTRSFRKKISKARFCNDLPSCNLFIKKEAFTEIGLFNEELSTGEDLELCNRIIKKEKKIYFNSKVIVYHHNRRLFIPFINQRIVYGLSVFKVFKENKSILNLYLFLPLLFLLFLFITGTLSIFYNPARILLIITLGIYLLIVGEETLRSIDRNKEIPLTIISLILGNLSPGLGSLLSLLNININIKRVYKNFYEDNKKKKELFNNKP